MVKSKSIWTREEEGSEITLETEVKGIKRNENNRVHRN